MRAKVLRAIIGVADDKTAPETFAPGAEIEGNLAYQAASRGYAEWIVRPTDAEDAVMRNAGKPKHPVRLTDAEQAKEDAKAKAEEKERAKAEAEEKAKAEEEAKAKAKAEAEAKKKAEEEARKKAAS